MTDSALSHCLRKRTTTQIKCSNRAANCPRQDVGTQAASMALGRSTGSGPPQRDAAGAGGGAGPLALYVGVVLDGWNVATSRVDAGPLPDGCAQDVPLHPAVCVCGQFSQQWRRVACHDCRVFGLVRLAWPGQCVCDDFRKWYRDWIRVHGARARVRCRSVVLCVVSVFRCGGLNVHSRGSLKCVRVCVSVCESVRSPHRQEATTTPNLNYRHLRRP
jgi:hypothetical protein